MIERIIGDGVSNLVPGNRWDLLPAVARPLRHPEVSVCIPTRNGGRSVVRTLSMLALQSYPMSRIEVVVADDGSDPPFSFDAASVPYELRVVRQDASGFGAGRARNLAAASASGSVLVLLDADVIPEPTVIEQYVDWVGRSSLCVPFGFNRFVDLTALADEQLARGIRTGSVEQLVDADDLDSQNYREPYLRATSDLTDERLDLFRVFVAATFAVDAEFFSEVGGFRELGVRGVEDVELGYRLANRGAVLVPVRSAQHWHQGRRTMSGDRIEAIRHRRQPYVERLLPVGGFRGVEPLGPGPVESVCRFVAHVDGSTEAGSVTVRSLLEMPPEEVQVADRSRPAQMHAFADVFLPGDVSWTHRTGSLLLDVFERTGAGTIKLVRDDRAPILVRRRRAANRTGVASSTATNELAEQLFGVAAVLAEDVDLGTSSAPGQHRHRKFDRGRIGPWWRRLRRSIDRGAVETT